MLFVVGEEIEAVKTHVHILASFAFSVVMIPDSSRILCIWVVVIFVLARYGVVGCPTVKRSAVVLAVDMNGRVCWADVVKPYYCLSASVHLEGRSRHESIIRKKLGRCAIRVDLFSH